MVVVVMVVVVVVVVMHMSARVPHQDSRLATTVLCTDNTRAHISAQAQNICRHAPLHFDCRKEMDTHILAPTDAHITRTHTH